MIAMICGCIVFAGGLFCLVAAKDEHDKAKRLMDIASEKMDRANKIMSRAKIFYENMSEK